MTAASGVVSRVPPSDVQADISKGKRVQLLHAFIRPGLGSHKPMVFIRVGAFRVMNKGRYANYGQAWRTNASSKSGRYIGHRREVIMGVRGMTAQELMRHTPGAMAAGKAELAETMRKNLAHEVAWLKHKATGEPAE